MVLGRLSSSSFCPVGSLLSTLNSLSLCSIDLRADTYTRGLFRDRYKEGVIGNILPISPSRRIQRAQPEGLRGLGKQGTYLTAMPEDRHLEQHTFRIVRHLLSFSLMVLA